MESIREIIIVEGRDDEAALKRAVDARIIVTHGFGISESTFSKIRKAYETRGIIIFTDPDFAGEKIRARLREQFPHAKHAYLSRENAFRGGDIGVENASPENILHALQKSRCVFTKGTSVFSMEDLIENDLVGTKNAGKRRDLLGAALGIGYGNAKTFLSQLNAFGITREEFLKAVRNI